jgi:hypothetical protein
MSAAFMRPPNPTLVDLAGIEEDHVRRGRPEVSSPLLAASPPGRSGDGRAYPLGLS